MTIKPVDAIVVTLTLHGKIQQQWVYSIENGDPDRVNGSLVVAQSKMEELIKKHDNTDDISEEEWAEILEGKEYNWDDANTVILTFSSKETP